MSTNLTVRINNKFPFTIETVDQNGKVVRRRDMPGVSTAQKTVADVMSGRYMPSDLVQPTAEANAKAVADEVLHAAAADLRDALRGLLQRLDDGDDYGPKHAISIARAAYQKATDMTAINNAINAQS